MSTAIVGMPKHVAREGNSTQSGTDASHFSVQRLKKSKARTDMSTVMLPEDGELGRGTVVEVGTYSETQLVQNILLHTI